MTPDLDLDAAIRTVVEAIDEEGTQGELDRCAEGLQVNAWFTRARLIDPDEPDDMATWRAVVQRRAAREYEAAREAFMRAYRFEKAMEVLRGR
jgi:hypothetical protein